jgi:energy-coupling factor transporter ATP-binding protein EcfA2
VNPPTILRVDLDFGRHADSFELEAQGPVVITGPNGSGKTTLIDAILRTIYGFRRRRTGDAELYQARRPWSGGPYKASLRVRDPAGEELTWSRDFDTDEVCVRTADGTVVFEGEANPGGAGPTIERYRDVVRSVFGLDDLDDCDRTTNIRQGALLDTTFDGDLLALAEGGHARVQAALDEIEAAHKELSRQPVVEGGRRLNRDRQLEQTRAALTEARMRLEEAQRADRARGPIVLRLTDLEQAEERLESELAELEPALRRLFEKATAAAVHEAASERLDRLVQLRADLDDARRAAESAERELTRRAVHGEYPDGFRSTAADLRSAWKRLADLDRQVATTRVRTWGMWAGGAGAAFLATGAILTIRGSVVGWVVALLGASLGITALVREVVVRRERGAALAECAEVEASVEALLDGVPDSGTVTPATLPDRLDAFERQDEARRQRAASGNQVGVIAGRIREAADAAGTTGRSIVHLESDARQRLIETEAALTRIEKAIPESLPGDLTCETETVESAIASARVRLHEARGERERLALELAGSARATVGISGLEDECELLESRVEELRRSAEAHRAAHRLVREAYAEFREQDEARLVEAVAKRIRLLGKPVLAGFRADDGLCAATVEIEGRRVALDSRELSFGQRHLVKLAIRLGTADFLGVAGLPTPLVVDEPFAHLDDRHSGQVWQLLVGIAAERQVIVTTQETHLLRRLGVSTGVVELADEQRERGATPEPGNVLEFSTAEPAAAGKPGGDRALDGGVV